MDFPSTAKCWDNHVIPRLAGEKGEIYRLIRSPWLIHEVWDCAIFGDYWETTHFTTLLLTLFCGFISIFIFLVLAALSVRFPSRCAVFWVTAILCFHGASIYNYLFSISICSYYTRDFPRLFFPLVFSSLVVYYFMCYIIYIFVRLWRFLMFGGYLSNIP